MQKLLSAEGMEDVVVDEMKEETEDVDADVTSFLFFQIIEGGLLGSSFFICFTESPNQSVLFGDLLDTHWFLKNVCSQKILNEPKKGRGEPL